MIILSIILCIFANVIRWADLADNATVRSFKDYFVYNDNSSIMYNIIWALITVFTLVIIKIIEHG